MSFVSFLQGNLSLCKGLGTRLSVQLK